MTEDRDAKFLEALNECDSVEDLETLLAEQFGETDALVMPRSITVTYKCSLCSASRPTRQIVNTTGGIESHTLQVSTCGECEERLGEWTNTELVRVLMNLLRYGKLRPEQVRWIRLGGEVSEQLKEMGSVPIPPLIRRIKDDPNSAQISVETEEVDDSENGGN